MGGRNSGRGGIGAERTGRAAALLRTGRYSLVEIARLTQMDRGTVRKLKQGTHHSQRSVRGGKLLRRCGLCGNRVVTDPCRICAAREIQRDRLRKKREALQKSGE